LCTARSKKRKPRDAANRRGSARAVDPHSLPFRKDRLGILAQSHGDDRWSREATIDRSKAQRIDGERSRQLGWYESKPENSITAMP